MLKSSINSINLRPILGNSDDILNNEFFGSSENSVSTIQCFTTLSFSDTVDITYASHFENIVCNTTYIFTDTIDITFAPHSENINCIADFHFSDTVDITFGSHIEYIENITTLEFIDIVDLIDGGSGTTEYIQCFTSINFSNTIEIDNASSNIKCQSELSFSEAVDLTFLTQIEDVECKTNLEFIGINNIIEFVWVYDLLGKLRDNKLKTRINIYDE